MTQATPQQLRIRAAQHRRNWQAWWRVSPREARDELSIAKDLERLADEAEQWRMAA